MGATRVVMDAYDTPKPLWIFVVGMLVVTALAYDGPAQLVRGFQARGPIDLFQDYTGSALLRKGRSPYSEEFKEMSGLEVNGHPPTMMLWLLPFTHLSFGYVAQAWKISILACSAILATLVAFMFFLKGRWLVALLLCVTLVISPITYYTVGVGQVSMHLALLITAAWLAARKGYWNLAGGFVALAATLKLFPLLFLVLFFALRRWSALITATALFVFAAATPSLMTGQNLWSQFSRAEHDTLLPKWVPNEQNGSLFGLLHHIVVPTCTQNRSFVSNLFFLVCTLGLLLVAVAAWFAYRSRNKDLDLLFSLFSALSVFLSPLAWEHYNALMFAPLLFLSVLAGKQNFWMRWAQTVLLMIAAHAMYIAFEQRGLAASLVRIGQNPSHLKLHLYYDLLTSAPFVLIIGIAMYQLAVQQKRSLAPHAHLAPVGPKL